jgi:hypothetical protein
MNRKFNNNNYFVASVATISFILLYSTITNPLVGYDMDDVKSSIAYEEALDEYDLPTNTKNFSMELDNGLVANYYLAPNQTFVFDGVSGAITEQNDIDDNSNDWDGNKIKYYVDVKVTTTYSYPQLQDKPQDPRNDPKYDSIDWQDDDPSKNLSVEEMDKILEEKEQNNNDNDEGNSDHDNSSNENGNDGGSSSGDDSNN